LINTSSGTEPKNAPDLKSIRLSPPRDVVRAFRAEDSRMHTDLAETNPSKLRELASWYRDFAERAGNPIIWEARLRTAKELEAEADVVERRQASRSPAHLGEADENAG
jgi:hypothetical protein